MSTCSTAVSRLAIRSTTHVQYLVSGDCFVSTRVFILHLSQCTSTGSSVSRWRILLNRSNNFPARAAINCLCDITFSIGFKNHSRPVGTNIRLVLRSTVRSITTKPRHTHARHICIPKVQLSRKTSILGSLTVSVHLDPLFPQPQSLCSNHLRPRSLYTVAILPTHCQHWPQSAH
jgi:hypothetical protein